MGYIVIAAVTVPNLWIAVVLKSSNAAALSGIVFLSITVTHVTDASPWIFAWYRASETLVGIAVGSLIGPYTSRFFSDIWLKRLFIVLALYVGTDYVLRGFFSYRIFG